MRSLLAALLTPAALTVVLLCVAPSQGAGQTQLSGADSAAVLLEVALQFEAERSTAVAQALYQRIIDRFGSTPAAARAEAALTRLAEQLAEQRAREPASAASRAASAEPGRRASVELQVWSTLYGLWLGVALPASFGADQSEPYGLGLLLGGPAGYLTGRTVARRLDPSWGQVRAITLGGSWGTWQGFGWREVLDLSVEEVCVSDLEDTCWESDQGDEEIFATMLAGGLVGIAAGALLGRNDVSPASATGANFGSLWGTWLGTATGVLVDLEGDDLLATALLAGNAGLAAGALGTPRLGWSQDRWRLVSIAGVLGGLAGLGIDLLIEPDDEKVAIGIPLAGSLAGLGVGMVTSRGTDAVAAAAGPDRQPMPAAPSGALAQWRDGRLDLAPPAPVLRRMALDTPVGPQLRTVVGIELFRAIF